MAGKILVNGRIMLNPAAAKVEREDERDRM
jgi:hypothetical protein